ncbi:mechanosensitive ion channel family protein [Caulobacter segnis]|uniref:mechanosensitive ion channel family protein n=1 Tax=Caulobacter segnis TaxID=88688 RepID=UPI001CBE6D14|nr:mechanosensitive ion channel family protein [Caulobacter segnis]UAL10181.1 mechanosensitive ion channel family protein [Caulobacter segnis]
MIALAVAAVLATYPRRVPLSFRFGFNLLACATVTLVLWHRGQTPFFVVGPGHLTPPLWLRLLAVAWWVLAARAAVTGLRLVLRRDRSHRQTRLVSDLMGAGIYVAAVFAVLNGVLGLPVQGLLATSGVIAVVLGLALQSTLSDVFAGVAVGIEGPFRVGDRIRLGEKFEGEVVQLNWRSIRLETDDDDVVVIPNSLVAKAEIINRSTPSLRRAGQVEAPVSASARPEAVIELIERAVMLCPAIAETPTPKVVLASLGLRINRYRVGFFVDDARELGGAKSLLLRQIRRSLHHAGLFDDLDAPAAAALVSAGTALSPERIFAEMLLFERLTPKEIGILATGAEHLHLEPGETLFVEGQADARLYIIASGVFAVAQTTPGGERDELGRVGPGDYLGEISLLTGEPLKATASALTHAEVYALDREALAPVVTANPELAAALERSARQGLGLIHRRAAALAGPEAGARGSLIEGVRRLLRMRRGPAKRPRPPRGNG